MTGGYMLPILGEPERIQLPGGLYALVYRHEKPDSTHTHRCGAPRTDGHPCRAYVARHADTCRWHTTHPACEETTA